MRLRALLLALFLVGLGGCGEDPAGPELPPLLFLPSESSLTTGWGQEMVFQVRTAAGDPFEAAFSVDGTPAGRTSVLRWTPEALGPVEVLAVAGEAGRTRTWVWRVEVTEAGLQPLKPVSAAAVIRRPQVGVLEVDWIAPLVATSQPDLARYEIAWAEGSLPADPFAEAAVETVLHRRGVDHYELVLEDLTPGAEHNFRVRAVDALGRRGPDTGDLAAVPVQLFDLEGRIRRALGDGLPQPVSDARLVVPLQGLETHSGADGRFLLAGMRDYLPTPVSVAPPAPGWYPMLLDLDDRARRPELVLLPRKTVTVLLSGVPTPWELLTLLRSLAGLSAPGGRIARWESYPVDVQIPDLVLGHGVDYGLAVQRGIETWNTAVGREILRGVDAPPAVGATTTADLTDGGGGRLGEVSLLEPATGLLYRTVPVRVKLALSSYFASQGICDRVVLHELGHVLWLAHSPSADHVMHAGVSSTSPLELHPDEVEVLRLLLELPNGTRMDEYRLEP
jgi:hypothetical protein